MERERYTTDLTDEQWAQVHSVLPGARNGRGGRPRRWPVRAVWDALFYQARNGCSRRNLPHDLPPWNVVWGSFRRWRANGTLAQVHEALRASVRRHAGKAPQPTAAILGSQAVRTAGKRGAVRATTRAKA
ncbi:transposase [Hymenobacter elongatus]|uniref:Transposase n=1 Tax=Hymenobacter elongatus TaxID=877208 RepID=A0A4Z0PI57_9BACT|nr:transposase [Hymenobacter elongatus]